MIGCVAMSRNGRIIDVASLFGSVSFESSYSDRYVLSPVRLRSFFALVWSSLGPYVSWRKNTPTSWITASAIELAQKTHRQETFDAM